MNINSQEKILKPSPHYLSRSIGAIVLVLIICPAASIVYVGQKLYVVSGLLMLMGIVQLISELRAAHNNRIAFTKSDIDIKVGKNEFKQSWESIKAVKITGQKQLRQLTLYREDDMLRVPCGSFDETELLSLIKEHLSPAVLDPYAYQKLPHFLAWQENITRKLLNQHEPLKVSLGNYERWVGIVGICFGLFFVGLYYISPTNAATMIFLSALFGGLGLFLVFISFGWIEGNTETISVRTLFRRYDFSWGTLKKIYFNSNRGILALVSDDSRLILVSPAGWSGKDKALLAELVNLKIEMSKIEPIESIKPVYWWSKN